MSNDAQLTITGNLVDDPELRYTPNGLPAVRFRIASTPRFYDKAGNRPAARPGRAAGRRVGRTSPPLISPKYVDPDLLHPAMTSSGQRRSPAGSGGHSHGSALNALPPGQVVLSEACQAAAPINQFGPAEFTKERADATRHIARSDPIPSGQSVRNQALRAPGQ